jgi:hypothetical protein
MNYPIKIPYTHVQRFEICSCGHPYSEHGWGDCRLERSNCNCRKFRSFLSVQNKASFLRPHISTGIGHALIQALIHCEDDVETIDLSDRDLGVRPECYRCSSYTNRLMPILMDRHSSRAVKEVSKGKMTRMWCDSCCNREDIEFFPGVAIVIGMAWDRRRIRKTFVP